MTGDVLPGIVAQVILRCSWPPDVLILMTLNPPSEQATLDSGPALAGGAGKALPSYQVCAHTGALNAQLHSNNLPVAINKIPAGLLSHMDMTLKQCSFFILCVTSLMLSSVSLF